MNKYLLIESNDPFEEGGGRSFYELAVQLAEHGDEVILFLVQNGVLAARTNMKSSAVTEALARGVTVVADEFSLRERGIRAERLLGDVDRADVDLVVDRMADGYRALWH